MVEEDASFDDIDEKAVISFIKQAQKAERVEIEDNTDAGHLFENLELLREGKLKRAAILLFG